jgi:hypothetical protein
MKTIEYKPDDVIIARVGVMPSATPYQVRSTLQGVRRAIKKSFYSNQVLVLAEIGGLGVDITFARKV